MLDAGLWYLWIDGDREADGGEVKDEGTVGEEEWLIVFLSVQPLDDSIGP